MELCRAMEAEKVFNRFEPTYFIHFSTAIVAADAAVSERTR
jgi:hypothetical protein